MAKLSIFQRISRLIRANTNTMLDKAEDPEKMLEQMVNDFRSNIQSAESSIAQTIGNLRITEEEYQSNISAFDEWGMKAMSASTQAESFRKKGKLEEATRFDNLAKVAIQRQMDAESRANQLKNTIQIQRESVEQLKLSLSQMRTKHQDLQSKRDELMARKRAADTQAQLQSAMSKINVTDTTNEINRYEETVRQIEAQNRGYQELRSSSLESQFAELESGDVEVEARLAALKNDTDSSRFLTSLDDEK